MSSNPFFGVLFRALGGLIALVCSQLITLPAPAAPSQGTNYATYPFFPFCIDWHDARKRDFKEQAEMLKELGYAAVL